jgi:hypothetical protein
MDAVTAVAATPQTVKLGFFDAKTPATCRVADVMRARGPRLFQVRAIHEDVCRTDEMLIRMQLR